MRAYRFVVLCLFVFGLTSTLEHWVGDATLYSQRAMRSYTHDLVIGKQSLPPGRTLGTIGAQGTNRRVLIPWLAEFIANRLGGGHDRVLAVYYYIDWISLYSSFLLFWIYLRRWFDPLICLVGMTYLAVALVTTYQGFFFHPWDRPLFLLWLLMAIFIRDGHSISYLVTFLLSLLTKFTAAILPLLYVLVHFGDVYGSRRRRIVLVLAAQAVLVVGCYIWLNRVSGSGLDVQAYAATLGGLIKDNWKVIETEKLTHPASLMFLCPLLVIPAGWNLTDRFMRCSVYFAAIFLGIHFVGSVFTETRAMTASLIFLLPAALKGLTSWQASFSKPRP